MKLIVSDIDGTLLVRGMKTLSGRDVKIISEAAKDNIFAAATGRSYCETKHILKGIDNCIHICCEGAFAVYDEETVFEVPFTKEQVMSFADCENIALYAKYVTYVKGTDIFVRRCREQFHAHTIMFDNPAEIEEHIYKAAVYDAKYSDFKCSGLKRSYCSYGLYEYIRDGADKLAAVKSIIKASGTDSNDCIVFGDGDNDKSLLKAFKNSYAMAWAKPSVKACAGFVCENVTDILKGAIIK